MIEVPQLEGHTARRVHGMNARKDYICPECGSIVPTGTSHVVAWPHEQQDLRRHWHTGCWRAVCRRGRR